MFKKFLALLLVVVLTATIAVAGTLAYLQDQDEAVNVMTLGNVSIEQHEYERVEQSDNNIQPTNLKVFENGKPLYPAVGKIEFAGVYQQWPTGGSNEMFDDALKNVQDKFVFIENTGKSDAYVRNVFLFEIGELEFSVWDEMIHLNINGLFWTWSDMTAETIIELDGNKYVYCTATYTGSETSDVHKNGVLTEGETSRPSLLQVFLDSAATNDTVNDIDGNGNGTLDILVLSQAVQVEGFADAQTALDTAFGEANKANVAGWFGSIKLPVTVSNNEELADAIESGAEEITLKAGTYQMPAAAKGKTLTINGSGVADTIIEVVPAGQSEAGGQLDYSLDGSTVTFNNLTIKTNSQLYAGYARLSGTYNNCVIQNTYNCGVGTSEFNNCVFNITNEYLRVGGAYSASFNNCTFNTDGRAILVFQDGTNVKQTVTVKDCTFNATAAAKTWNGIHVAAVSIDGTNGTYVVNLEGTNTVDSDFNGLWQIKAGEDNVTVNA